MVDIMDHVQIRHYDCPKGRRTEERYDHIVPCPKVDGDGGECTCPPLLVWPEFIELDALEPDLGYHDKKDFERGHFDLVVMECSNCTTRVQYEFLP